MFCQVPENDDLEVLCQDKGNICNQFYLCINWRAVKLLKSFR